MTVFTSKAPKIMADLRRDFAPLSAYDAAAVVGNLGHESGGFTLYQEVKPLVAGSRGGAGWAQWTGPRRKAFEAWAAKKGLNPRSDEANYGYLCVELRGSEKAAIPAVRRAESLEAKVTAFELNFERAGIKHYASRIKYAKQALAAYQRAALPPPPPDVPTPAPDAPTPPASPAQPPALVVNIIVLIVLAVAAFGIWQWIN